MSVSDSSVQPIQVCPLCGSRAAPAPHGSGAAAIAQCTDCGLVMRHPQPSDATLRAIYGPGYFFGAGDPPLEAATSALKSATADGYLDALERYRGPLDRGSAAPRLLDVGCGHGDLLVRARARGYDVHGVDVSADAVQRVQARLGSAAATRDGAGDLSALQGAFDVCVLSDVIEHARNPAVLLGHVRRVLAPGGTLLISTPSITHWTARLLKRHWMEFKEEHLFYFDPQTIERLLRQGGFDQLSITSSWKTLSLDYLGAHFRRFPVPLLRPIVTGLQRLTPPAIRRRPFPLPTGGIVVLARSSPESAPDTRHDFANRPVR
ncbi:MAG TPA: class I SAM-dependent methyltransferase [Vicinamibacterales bacterium]|nr:class I SAM-dependent methyltransferase [Vicinamibacterales bacterium]